MSTMISTIALAVSFMAVSTSLCAQDRAQAQITEADIPAILESVAEYVVSHPIGRDERSLEGRHVYIAGEDAEAAFREVVPNLKQLEAVPGAAYTISDARVAALSLEDGVLLTVRSIEQGPKKQSPQEPDKYVMGVSVQWHEETGATSESVALALTESEGRWLVSGEIYAVF